MSLWEVEISLKNGMIYEQRQMAGCVPVTAEVVIRNWLRAISKCNETSSTKLYLIFWFKESEPLLEEPPTISGVHNNNYIIIETL
jgi:hypothetical protein